MAKQYTLLRLTPGPAEARFGITAAPMAVIADYRGRVTVRRVYLRDEVNAASRRLKDLAAKFDRRAAERPLTEIPDWAEDVVAEGGGKVMAAFLEKVHPTSGREPRRGPKFADLVALYGKIDRDYEKIGLATNYIAALKDRRTANRKDVKAWQAEAGLLKEMTFCVNDSVKFAALKACGDFLPVGEIGFFPERAARKAENCLNPNVLLCRAAEAVGKTAARLPADAERDDRRAVLRAVPFLAEILTREGRNNGACTLARKSLESVATATGEPSVLTAYLACFCTTEGETEWLAKFTTRFNLAAAEWLESVTGMKFGPDPKAWSGWLKSVGSKLTWDRKRGVFRKR